MLDTKKRPRKSQQPPARSVRITGRKLAGAAPTVVHSAYGLEPRDHVRSVVALLASGEQNQKMLLEIAQPFIDDPRELAGLSLEAELYHLLHQEIVERMQLRGIAPAARFRLVQRMRSSEHGGYPLRRTQVVIFNYERTGVTAQLREVSAVLKLQGMGDDEHQAFKDLERQFELLVQTKVRIPPHAREERDERVRTIVDFLVNWEQFAIENPHPRLLWGKVLRHAPSGVLTIHWLIGPDGVRDRSAPLPPRFRSPYLGQLKLGEWFQAVYREFPEKIDWVEPPTSCPDPTDPKNQRAAWDAIPKIEANDPEAWPLKRE